MKNLKIAFRESQNATRPYVIVNELLAKHMPVAPSHALEYFDQLGNKVSKICTKECVLIVGFAETATAVGAVVAATIGNAVYVHTTREVFSEDKLISAFLEEHSHAKNQALYLSERDLSWYKQIIFVEDEITTGKTILNFLKSVDYAGKIIVSALVFNGLDKSTFASHDAEFVCLQQFEESFNNTKALHLDMPLKKVSRNFNKKRGAKKYKKIAAQRFGFVKKIWLDSLPNPRLGVDIDIYIKECQRLTTQVTDELDEKDIRDKSILIVGTEEFMYPALILGREIEKTAKSVRTHSTTRSTLLVKPAKYPLYSRVDFASVYDSTRTTHLYNLCRYDTVIIITDSPAANPNGLLGAIQSQGNKKIYYVRVCNV